MRQELLLHIIWSMQVRAFKVPKSDKTLCKDIYRLRSPLLIYAGTYIATIASHIALHNALELALQTYSTNTQTNIRNNTRTPGHFSPSGLPRSSWFCNPTHCELYKFKIRTLLESYSNFPNYPNTGIQQGNKLKSVCMYIFRWIFDCGRETTLNRLSSLTVGKLFHIFINKFSNSKEPWFGGHIFWSYKKCLNHLEVGPHVLCLLQIFAKWFSPLLAKSLKGSSSSSWSFWARSGALKIKPSCE